MNIKKPLLRWSVAVLAVLTLTACGSTTSSPTSAPTTSAPTTSAPTTENPAVQKAQTGQVTFAVQFPQAALKKALIDDRTASISVEWQIFNPFASGTALLTPDPVTHIATATLDVPVGTAYFSAFAKDSSGAILDMTSTAGEIAAGNNTVYLTFLGGDWQFVDAGDNPLPQSFGATTLAGFSLKSGQAYAGPTRATIDLGKPSTWSEYQLQWHDSTPAALGPMMWAGQGAQFNAPAATGSTFDSDWLNITDPTRSGTYNGGGLEPVQGDRLVWIMSWAGDGPTSITDGGGGNLIPAFQAVGDSQVLDGNHLGGHLLAMTFESYAETNINTNVDCQVFWFAQSATPAAARAAAIKASLTKAAGKAAVGDETVLTAGTATVNYSECYTDWSATQIDGDGDTDMSSEPLTYDANGNGRYDTGDGFIDNNLDGHWDYTYYPGTSYDVTEVYSNVVAREFRAKGSQAGSVFTPPAVQASAVGTWMNIDPVTNSVAILAFVDNSNYLMGEDGVADTGGGPGVEVGTYNFDSVAAETTFNVTYETNGDWGPATVGIPTTYPVLDLTESTLTVGDPIDGTPFSFNRVVPDPTNPIVGSWFFGGPFTDAAVLVFQTDGTYYAVQIDSLLIDNRFFESGTYTWNSTTGAFTGTGVFSSNPLNSAIAAPSETNTLTINVSGNTLTLTDVDGTFTATRL